MPEVTYRTPMPASPEALYAWHARYGAFQRLLPPWERLRLVSWQGGEATRHLPDAQQRGDISTGATVTLRAGLGPLSVSMVARHVAHEEGRFFADRMVQGPFRSWLHSHRFLPDPDHSDGSILEDQIAYTLPLGALGQAVGGGFAARTLERMFAFRHRRTAQDLERHRRYSAHPRLTVAVTGASGLVGQQLVAFLRTGGHRVRPLTRRRPLPGSDEIQWDPAAGTVDTAALEGIDAVIHLAGESIMGRWTAAKQARIRDSRVQGTATLARALAGQKRPPRVLISTSAVGIYGDRGDTLLSEDDDRDGAGFLAGVCREWEAAADPARAAGIRVVHPRLGVVLSGQGGALAAMLPPFWLGLGGPVGSGQQWVSWIGLDDLLGLLYHALFTESLSGPVSAVAPQPVTSAELGRTLGRVLRRPAVLPLPAPAVRLALGQMGEELLLYSARVSAARAQESGFTFLHPTLEEALRAEVGA